MALKNVIFEHKYFCTPQKLPTFQPRFFKTNWCRLFKHLIYKLFNMIFIVIWLGREGNKKEEQKHADHNNKITTTNKINYNNICCNLINEIIDIYMSARSAFGSARTKQRWKLVPTHQAWFDISEPKTAAVTFVFLFCCCCYCSHIF